MANAAFELGWQSERENRAARQKKKDALADEERKIKVTDLITKRDALAKNALALQGDDRDKAMNALQDIDASLTQIYHPNKNPGALQKDWGWLSGMIQKRKPAPAVLAKSTEPGTGTAAGAVTFPGQQIELPPSTLPNVTGPTESTYGPRVKDEQVDTTGASTYGPLKDQPATEETINVNGKQIAVPRPLVDISPETVKLPATPNLPTVTPRTAAMTPQQRQAMKQRADARKQAEQDVLAAGLTPEQQINNTMRQAESLMGPDWDEDDKEAFKKSLVTTSLGIAPKEKYFSQIVTTTDVNNKQHYWRVPMSGAPPVEVDFNGQAVVPKSKAGGLTYNMQTGVITDKATGKPYFKGDKLNPPDVQRMFASIDVAKTDQREYMHDLARERGEAYNDSRPVQVRDNYTGETNPMRYGDFIKAAQDNPGRYIAAPEYDKWAPRVNMLEDIRGASRITRKAIEALDYSQQWDEEAKAAVAVALKSDHPDTALRALLNSAALGTLTDNQRQFVIATAGLAEQAMGMRAILGAGQGSEDVRRAIALTLPDLLSPSPEYALKQLDYFNGTLERVHRIIPTNVRIDYNLGNKPWTVEDAASPDAETVQMTDITPADIAAAGGAAPAGVGAGAPAGGGAARAPAGPPARPGVAGPKGAISLAVARKAHPDWNDQQLIDDLWKNGFGWTR